MLPKDGDKGLRAPQRTWVIFSFLNPILIHYGRILTPRVYSLRSRNCGWRTSLTSSDVISREDALFIIVTLCNMQSHLILGLLKKSGLMQQHLNIQWLLMYPC